MKHSKIRPGELAPAADDATREYLNWLAGRRGVAVPDGAIHRIDGIWSGYGKGAALILPMPGYGVSDVVTIETLDETGAVVRAQRIAVAPSGSIALKADQVLAATGLTKGRKPRAAAPRFPLDPRQALRMTAAEMAAYCRVARGEADPVAPAPAAVEPVASAAPPVDETSAAVVELADPVDAAAAPAAPPVADAAALLARIAKLEATVDVLLLHALDQPAPGRGNDEAPAVEMVTAGDLKVTHGHDNPEPLPADPRAGAVLAMRREIAAERAEAARAPRLRIVRRYLAMRAERAEMRAQLASAQARTERAEFDAIEAQGREAIAVARADAADALTAPAIDAATARLVRLEREVATWEARAKQAGWKAPPFQLAALMTGRRPAEAA